MSRPLRRLLACLALGLCGTLPVLGELLELPPFEPDPAQVAYLQRSITLLNSGTPTHRPAFRLLFYGNSHVTRPWVYHLANDLQKAFPYVGFYFTNKALVAFDTAKLTRTAVADIGQWQPDLVVVTSYGAFGEPDLGEKNDFIPFYRKLRELTTADVLVFPSHPIYPEEANEPSVPIDDPDLNPWYPDQDPIYTLYYVSLPKWANASGHAWANIRTPWKEYLRMHGMATTDLLLEDQWHTNDDGGEFMRILLRAHLLGRTFPTPMDPWNNARIRTATVGSEIHWDANALDLRFVGNRVDVIYDPESPSDSPTFSVQVDGKDPKDIPELYGFERASSSYGVVYPMPGVTEVQSEALLQEEKWLLHINSIDSSSGVVGYSVTGTKTGFDGSGTTRETFVSNSRRIRLQPEVVTAWWAFSQTQKTPPEDFNVEWNVIRNSMSTFKPVPPVSPILESRETLFLGTTDPVEHRLKITPVAGTARGIRAIRVYSPSGAALVADAGTTLQVSLSGDYVTLSWPVSSGGGRIETAASPSASVPWKPVAGVPLVQGNRYVISLPVLDESAVYRWRN
ncbi:MAG: hypothetical protein JNL10_12485 [Verrucomicrobiales bacterium]|nr:hypothetical protein [Verrucomicrobiales bacterium]